MQCSAGLQNSGFAIEYSIPIGRIDDGLKIKTGLAVATASGSELSITAERKVTELSKLEVSIGLGLNGAAIIRLR